MIKFKRKMEAEIVETDNSLHSCQASFNSSGCLTIRRYNPQDKNQDEIICFSEGETYAIISLFRKIKHDIANGQDLYGLPF